MSFCSFQHSESRAWRYEHKFVIKLHNKSEKKFESSLTKQLSINDQLNLKSIFPSLNIYSLTLKTDQNFEAVTKQLKIIPQIEFFDKDKKTNLRNTTPNDIDFTEQWNLELIGAPAAWDQTTGGKTVRGHDIVVAIIDNGFDRDHEDLIDNIWTNESEIPDNGVDDDENGYIDDYRGVNTQQENGEFPVRTHGTGVAGIIGAKGNNRLGISGINWNVKMMLISGQAFISDIIESYNYALTQRTLFNETDGDKGALVVATNFSSGIDEAFAIDYPVWCSVYDALGAAGILNVTAAANNGKDVDLVGDMPSTCPSEYLIVVNNIDRNEVLASDSGFGMTHIDLAAPGDEAFSLSIDNTYNDFSGTSSSTPHVAGAIALLYALDKKRIDTEIKRDPANTATTIKGLLYNSATRNENLLDKNSTGGRLNLAQAVAEAVEVFDDSNDNSLKVYPNPVGSGANIIVDFQVSELTNHELEIFDSMGRNVYKSSFLSADLDPVEIKIRLSEALLHGIYFLRVSTTSTSITKGFRIL